MKTSVLVLSLIASPALAQEIPTGSFLTPDDPHPGAFGSAVDQQDGIAVIGSPHAAPPSGAYVFEIEGRREQRFLPAGAIDGPEPVSVSIHGERIAVAATSRVTPALDGTVRLYSSETYAFQSEITPPPGMFEHGWSFGCSVALNGTHMVVGSYEGAALVDLATGSMTRLATDVDEYLYGRPVAANDDWIVVGGRGKVYVYRSGEEEPEVVLQGDDGATSFGQYVSIARDSGTMAVSAYGEGTVQIFAPDGDELGRIAHPDSRFLWAVDVDGDRLAVRGQTGVYSYGLDSLELLATFVSDEDLFGSSLSLDGTSLIAGAQPNSWPPQAPGRAYLFDVRHPASVSATRWIAEVQGRALIAVDGEDGSFDLWSVGREGDCEFLASLHPDQAEALCDGFTVGGKYFVFLQASETGDSYDVMATDGMNLIHGMSWSHAQEEARGYLERGAWGAGVGFMAYFAAPAEGSDDRCEVYAWNVDGGEPWLLRDSWSGVTGHDPAEFVVFQHRVYYTADDGVHGREIWNTGLNGGTVFHDLRPGPDGSDPKQLSVVGGFIRMNAIGLDGIRRAKHYHYELRDSGPLMDGPAYGSRHVAYYGVNGPEGQELWRGMTAGEAIFSPLPGSLLALNDDGSPFVEKGIETYFGLDSGGSGQELWRVDGSAPLFRTGPGERLAAAFDGGSARAYFVVEQSPGLQVLWSTDGTLPGTQPWASPWSIPTERTNLALVGGRILLGFEESAQGRRAVLSEVLPMARTVIGPRSPRRVRPRMLTSHPELGRPQHLFFEGLSPSDRVTVYVSRLNYTGASWTWNGQPDLVGIWDHAMVGIRFNARGPNDRTMLFLPNDPVLLGRQVRIQALVEGPGGESMTNCIELHYAGS